MKYRNLAHMRAARLALNRLHEAVEVDKTFGDLKLYRQGNGCNQDEPIVSNGAEIQAWGIEDARKLYEDLSDLLDYHDNRVKEDPAYAKMIKDYEEG
ncbi:hypothetical protein BI084_gp91 [Gordonia phage Terapin]|uniref:Uncharacterized protein n=3 Tax=Terapinvirus terapin TaxID=2734283 RepID=A0A345MBD0_9CAUD|nr:hypothetical protein BI084_gp91 [Gordonia phage Terapin]AOE44903.1 hypothetical protein SEA_TERAPIN_91 [Gordonia phage Terapin]AVP43367.1 hypothetical protein PBI_DJOKOVIC_90 [Gordonia phage Djokovic]AXH67801.1 hypothetical protein SEA_BEYONCAGE_90 [Gordonia phage Beyoncage]QYW00892.1 hypothetical protein SEA_MADI_89 [Gordonia phage Madi]